MSQRRLWAEAFLAVAIVYALALMYQMLNEFFDGSPPKTEYATVIAKRVRYNPVPISVLTVRNTSNLSYDVDVLPELAEKVSAGSQLKVVRQDGFFGKPWVQDEDFHSYLGGTRTIQGFMYLAFATVLAVFCFFMARRRFKTSSRATAALVAALVVAFGLFWVLP